MLEINLFTTAVGIFEHACLAYNSRGDGTKYFFGEKG
jgi:hypothetical protein